VGSAVAGAVPYLRDAAQAERRRHEGGRLTAHETMHAAMTPEQKKQNARLAWILASIALVLFVGFIAKAALFGI